MKSYPYFKWYPADAETDENFRLMTDEEAGFYLRCLNHSWINGGIPSDPSARAKALKRPKKTADRLWIAVSRCFHVDPSDPSRLVNRRQERERMDAKNRSENSSAAVRKRYVRSTTVELSYNDRNAGVLAYASACQSACDSNEGFQEQKPEVYQAPNPPPDLAKHDPARDQVRQWLHEFMGREWPPPSVSIASAVLAAASGHLDELEVFLVQLRNQGRRPSKSYSWFVSVVQERFRENSTA